MIIKKRLYSKTPLAQKIFKKKQFKPIKERNIKNFIGKLNLDNLNWQNKNYKDEVTKNMPGTLGWGLYAFDELENAKDFQGSPGNVLCYEVQYDSSCILDLWKDETCMRLLDDFLANKDVIDGLKAYKKYKKNHKKNYSIQKSDLGIIIELFIKSIKKGFIIKRVDVVRMATRNNFKNTKYNIDIYNGVEYCIKNDNIIKTKTLKIDNS